jgi:hypothetical protein
MTRTWTVGGRGRHVWIRAMATDDRGRCRTRARAGDLAAALRALWAGGAQRASVARGGGARGVWTSTGVAHHQTAPSARTARHRGLGRRRGHTAPSAARGTPAPRGHRPHRACPDRAGRRSAPGFGSPLGEAAPPLPSAETGGRRGSIARAGSGCRTPWHCAPSPPRSRLAREARRTPGSPAGPRPSPWASVPPHSAHPTKPTT